jgi:outer membrane protein OmpA-like peptidoglycan-associated protein
MWEGVAFFHAADQTIFFSSNGRGGQGGADIFRSKRLDDRWTEPEPITELNSPGNDMYLSIPASGDMAFFSSNNSGGQGQEDVYVAPLYFILTPEAISLRSLDVPTGERVTEAVQPSHIETLYFDLESYALNPSEIAKLDKVVEFMNEHPGVTIEVAGHACSMGNLDYNLILSKERADSSIKRLLKKGIAPERIKETYYGETRPAEPNDPVYGNPKNRRVEISILK